MEQEYFSPKQVSTHFGVSLRTVRRWIASGKLPAYRLGRLVRIKKSDIEALEARM